MTRPVVKFFALIALLTGSAPASAIILSASGGVDDAVVIENLDIGTSLEIVFQWTEVTAPGNWPTFGWQLVNPGNNYLSQDNRNAPTGVISRTLDTTTYDGQNRGLRLFLDVFDVTSSATVRVIDVLIDGRSVFVPAPAAIFLMGLGLIGIGAARRRSAV